MKLAVISLHRTGSKLYAKNLAEENETGYVSNKLVYCNPNGVNQVIPESVDLDSIVEEEINVLHGQFEGFNDPLLADIKQELNTNFTIHSTTRNLYDFVYSVFVNRHIRDNGTEAQIELASIGQMPEIDPFAVDLDRVEAFASWIDSQLSIAETFTISSFVSYESLQSAEDVATRKAYLTSCFTNKADLDAAIVTHIQPVVDNHPTIPILT